MNSSLPGSLATTYSLGGREIAATVIPRPAVEVVTAPGGTRILRKSPVGVGRNPAVREAARQPKYVAHKLTQRGSNGPKRRQAEVHWLVGVSANRCFERGTESGNDPARNEFGGLPVARD